MDLRERVRRAITGDASRRAAAAKFDLSISSWSSWCSAGSGAARSGRIGKAVAGARRLRAIRPGAGALRRRTRLRRAAPPAGGRGHRRPPVRDRPIPRRLQVDALAARRRRCRPRFVGSSEPSRRRVNHLNASVHQSRAARKRPPGLPRPALGPALRAVQRPQPPAGCDARTGQLALGGGGTWP
jgi:hypothetical protein